MLMELLAAVVNMQAEKNRTYGGEWKAFGFLSANFNVFRKFQRLRELWTSGWQVSKDEARFNTILDLTTYWILNILLYAELHPDSFLRALRRWRGMSTTPDAYPASTVGFQRFMWEQVEPKMREYTGDGRDLRALVEGEILPIGEECMEGWLRAASELIESLLKPMGLFGRLQTLVVVFGKSLFKGLPRSLSPEYRLVKLFELLPSLMLAVMRYAETCPEEYRTFLERWSSTQSTTDHK